MFIVLEGVDGGGKSTQIQLLADHVRQQGQTVVCCADPGTTAAGLQIRQLLLNSPEIAVAPTTELLLFFAARAQLVHEVIAPALAAGQTVLCDRFLLSTVVYQGHLGPDAVAARSLGRSALESAAGTGSTASGPSRIWQLGRLLFGDCLPDLTIVLDLPVEAALERTRRPLDRIESRGPEYLSRVRRAFLAEADAQPATIRVVDATRSPSAVAESIARLYDQYSAERQTGRQATTLPNSGTGTVQGGRS